MILMKNITVQECAILNLIAFYSVQQLTCYMQEPLFSFSDILDLCHSTSPVEVGVLYAFTTLIGRLFQPVQQVMQRLSIFQQALVSASRVFKLMDDPDMEPEQKEIKQC